MTSSLEGVVTSESPDVNVSVSNNVTVAATDIKGFAWHASPVIAASVRYAILFTLAVVNLCGNGFTLITIWKTPRLWTKTNFILTSMLVSHFITGAIMFCCSPGLMVVNVFSDPCHLNMVSTALTLTIKMTGYVSSLHTMLISVERYVAIVHPLQYEIKFNDRTMKRAISTVWAMGIFTAMTHLLWLINADRNRCAIIPVNYHLVDVLLIYIPGCVCLITCYVKIFAVVWRQRRRIEPQPSNANPVPEPSLQKTSVSVTKQSNKATASDDTVDSNIRPLTGTGTSSVQALTSGAASASELTQEQQRQKIKSRRREHKAVYLTAAIVGTFVILRVPHMLGRVLASAGYNPVVTNYIGVAGGAIGAANFAFTWLIYAAVSKSYRRAYRQMLIRIGCCCCKNVTLPADHSLVV